MTVILFIGFLVVMMRKYDTSPSKELAFAIAFSLMMMVLPLVLFFYRPKSYSITEEAVVVNRLAGTFRIPFSSISHVIRADRSDMRLAIRTFGNGGIFGFTGTYRNSKFGKMRWFVTQRTNYIVIETTDGKKFVITPDEPEPCFNEILNRVKIQG